MTIRELVDTYEKVAALKLRIQWGARAYRARETMRPIDRHSWLPGWSPKVGLSCGLKRTIPFQMEKDGE